MKTLAKVIHGSKLYGLDSEASDTDYKGLFLPGLKELVLMMASKNETYKIKENNEEYENFALQHFLKLCANGEDVCITMLHASQDKILLDSEIYKYLRDNRAKFYTKRIIGSLGYAKSMAVKYSLRADRMADVERVIKFLTEAQAKGVARLYSIWDDLPSGAHISFGTEPTNKNDDKRFYSVSNKKVTPQVAVAYALEIYQSLYDKYGDRVKIAKNLDGSDFKAISHSFRVGFQLRSIYKDGGFSYPLRETEFIKDVKYGRLNYLDSHLDNQLNELITEVEALADASKLPAKVDRGWMDDLILNAYFDKIINL